MPLEEMQNVVLTHNISYFEIFVLLGILLYFWPPQKKIN